MSKKTDYFPFKGGMNIVDPALSVPPGELIDGYNYECATRGGYTSLLGYERFDGHHLPSSSKYQLMYFNNGTNEPPNEATIVGGASTAVGVVLLVVIESGAWATNDAAGYFIVHVESGVFIDGEPINVRSVLSFSPGFSTGFL